jgi:phosphatidylinositol glycan class Q protein
MILKIFWPDTLKIQGKFVVGWRVFPGTVVVVDCVDQLPKDSQKTTNAEPLEILGVIGKSSEYLLTIQCDKSVPIHVESKEHAYCWIIYFTPPNRHSLQYLSTLPLVLDLKFTESQWEIEKTMEKQLMLEKLHSQYPMSEKDVEELEPILQKLNVVMVVKDGSGTRQRAKNALLSLMEALLSWTEPIWGVFVLYLALGLRMIIAMLHLNLPGLKVSLFQLSNTAQQLNLRVEQLLFWPLQYVKWYQSEAKLSPIGQAQYIGFFNTVWLIANDIILGLAMRSFIFEYRYVLAQKAQEFLAEYTCNSVERTIEWLLHWPGGLKLNAELALFLAELFQWMIFAWKEASSYLIPYLPNLFLMTGLLGGIGSTFIMSMLSDLLSLFTLHLQLFYIISAKIFHWIVQILDSTFHLFRGKRRNTLRNRVDSTEYDLDQLLLGTIIFTALAFLLPTVAVFYLLFSLVPLIDIGKYLCCNCAVWIRDYSGNTQSFPIIRTNAAVQGSQETVWYCVLTRWNLF